MRSCETVIWRPQGPKSSPTSERRVSRSSKRISCMVFSVVVVVAIGLVAMGAQHATGPARGSGRHRPREAVLPSPHAREPPRMSLSRVARTVHGLVGLAATVLALGHLAAV